MTKYTAKDDAELCNALKIKSRSQTGPLGGIGIAHPTILSAPTRETEGMVLDSLLAMDEVWHVEVTYSSKAPSICEIWPSNGTRQIVFSDGPHIGVIALAAREMKGGV